MKNPNPKTLFDKIWHHHLVNQQEDGTCLIYIDRHLVHEVTSPQAFEGMCIARKNNSVNSNFTVRKLSHGEGVERVFPLFGPMIEKIEVVRKGDVRRAKLYYLRDRTGKRARIADRDRGDEADQYSIIEEAPVEENTSNTDETSVVAEQENVQESKEAEAAQDEKKEEPAEEVKAEENKEEAPAEEAEKKTDEQS